MKFFLKIFLSIQIKLFKYFIVLKPAWIIQKWGFIFSLSIKKFKKN